MCGTITSSQIKHAQHLARTGCTIWAMRKHSFLPSYGLDNMIKQTGPYIYICIYIYIYTHVWEDFLCIGRLPICGKSSHMWEDFPYMGRLPIHGKMSHICWIRDNPSSTGSNTYGNRMTCMTIFPRALCATGATQNVMHGQTKLTKMEGEETRKDPHARNATRALRNETTETDISYQSIKTRNKQETHAHNVRPRPCKTEETEPKTHDHHVRRDTHTHEMRQGPR